MAKTVVGLFDTFAEAQNVIQSLIDTGVRREDISVVANDRNQIDTISGTTTHADSSASAEGAGAGAVGGTVIGGVLGLLVGLGVLAIPGIGPVLAAGSLATTLGSTALGAGIGAAAGGLVGALVGAGVPEEEAHVYSEGVRRGGTLLTVTADDTVADRVYDVMQQAGAVDIRERSTTYRSGGWDRFDPNGQPYDRGDSVGDDWKESSKVGTGGGTVAGAAAGAAVGSVGGPVGTVIGGIAGAAAGAGLGAAGDVAGRNIEETADDGMPRTGTSNTSTRHRSIYDVPSSERTMTGEPRPGASSVSGLSDLTASRGSLTGDQGAIAGSMDTMPRTGSMDNAAGDVRNDWEESSKVGTGGGALAGAAAGAAIGSAGGPVGTVIGGIAGAATGAGVGAAGDVAGENIEDTADGDYNVPRERAVGGFDNYDLDFRRDYDVNYATSGYTYDQYQAIYRYGYDLGADQRYISRDWDVIETDARRAWEERNPGTWERFKDAVRMGWDKARGLV